MGPAADAAAADYADFQFFSAIVNPLLFIVGMGNFTLSKAAAGRLLFPIVAPPFPCGKGTFPIFLHTGSLLPSSPSGKEKPAQKAPARLCFPLMCDRIYSIFCVLLKCLGLQNITRGGLHHVQLQRCHATGTGWQSHPPRDGCSVQIRRFSKTAVIIGAGPAGLTAAYELLTRSTHIRPVILEAGEAIGGISRTACYKGNRMDIGGHRFFSKSRRSTSCGGRFFPFRAPCLGRPAHRPHASLDPAGADPADADQVFLTRRRVSRIYFLKRFF